MIDFAFDVAITCAAAVSAAADVVLFFQLCDFGLAWTASCHPQPTDLYFYYESQALAEGWSLFMQTE